jgi:hypothetical protein
VPSVTDLAGRVFLSTSVTDQSVDYPLLSDTRFRLSFGDGTAGGDSGCAGYAGRFSIVDTRLVFYNPALTLVGCDEPHQRQDEWMVSLMSSGPEIGLRQTTLVLTLWPWVVTLMDRGNAPVVGTSWQGSRLVVSGQEVPFPARFDPVVTFGDATLSLQVGECWVATAAATIEAAPAASAGGADTGRVRITTPFSKAPLEGACQWTQLGQRVLDALTVDSFTYRVQVHELTIQTTTSVLTLTE